MATKATVETLGEMMSKQTVKTAAMEQALVSVHVVTPTPAGFEVESGRSGRTYLVVPLSYGGGRCNCERARRSIAIDARCSHVIAVEEYAAGVLAARPAPATDDPFKGFREPSRVTGSDLFQQTMESVAATLGYDAPFDSTMRVECSYCGASMGEQPCTAQMVGSVSHGVCPGCVPALHAKLGLEPEEGR